MPSPDAYRNYPTAVPACVYESEAERKIRACRDSLIIIARCLDGLDAVAMRARLGKENPAGTVLLALTVENAIALADELMILRPEAGHENRG